MRFLVLTLALLQAGFSGAEVSHIQALGQIRPLSSPLDERQVFERAVQKYSQSPVDARVDRVWHAIPGLQGFSLDAESSRRATAASRDGKIHLEWRDEAPQVSLRSLPPEPIYRGPANERSVCLMFNVSWGETFVPRILQCLKQEGVRATFFLDGDFVKKHAELARQIALDGHSIGSHGTGHPDFQRISTDRLIRQIVGTNQTIKHTLGVDPTLLAPPAGAYDARTVKLAAKHGMHTILWTTDTVDWRRPPASTIIRRVQQGVEPGSLILMHPTEPTCTALPVLIRWFKQEGYQMKTVAAVVNEQRAVHPPSVWVQG